MLKNLLEGTYQLRTTLFMFAVATGSVEIGDKAEGSPSSVTSPRGMHRRGKNSRQGTLTLRRGEGLSSVKEKENRPPVHENQKAA